VELARENGKLKEAELLRERVEKYYTRISEGK
jgi:hypothetical protein